MNCLTENHCIRKYTWILIAVWLLTIIVLLLWNIKAAENERENKALQSARSFFSLVAAAGIWNAGHDRVHVPKISSSQTKSHLQEIDVDKDITVSHTNSIFMTHLISEITTREEGITFHIASLKPSKMEYKTSEWEKKALKAFEEEGVSEYGAYVNGGSKHTYHYMAPLFTTERCLKCHEKQGYEIGDIRGGIRVTLPSEQKYRNWPLILSHGLAALAGAILFRFFANQLIQAEEKMELLASRDSLTGVANRRFFQEYLQREWFRAKRNGSSLSFLMCDIDFFKLYNDTYGHQAGDNCLSQVAEALASGLKRPGDFIARYGDEKFAIILPETSLHGAETLAGKILKRVEDLRIEHHSSAASKYLTVSIGVTNNETLSSPKEIIAHANKALYQAKKEGKNRVTCLSHDAEEM